MTTFGIERARGEVARAVPPPVEIAPSGHRLQTTWRAVAGATGARVAASTVTIWPDVAGASRSLGVVASGKRDVTEIVVDVPVRGALLRALRIPDLLRLDGEHEIGIRDQGDLGGDFHLILTPVVNGAEQAPVVAVPALPRRRQLPAQLTGGSLSGSWLTLPDPVGTRFKVKLVAKHSPEDFELQRFSHGDVTLHVAPMPVGLAVVGPAGDELFALGGPLRERSDVDVRAALERHLTQAVKGGGPVDASLTLRSEALGRASVRWSIDGGVIEREIDGRLTVAVEGAPTSVALPPPHPGRAPARTRADVTVTHHGLAIHPVSDPLPVFDAGQSGCVVRDTAVVRRLPVEALRGQLLRRVGVIGWPTGRTDLTLEVLGARVSVEGLAAPVAAAPPSLVWFDVGELRVERPVAIALTATRGGFRWIAAPHPLVRLAIAVAPEGESVTVGGRTIGLTGDETVRSGFALAGTDRWAIATDQFCTVSITNAVLEFVP